MKIGDHVKIIDVGHQKEYKIYNGLPGTIELIHPGTISQYYVKLNGVNIGLWCKSVELEMVYELPEELFTI